MLTEPTCQGCGGNPDACGCFPSPGDISGQLPGGPLEAARAAYVRWFGAEYDLGALDCVLAAAVAERLGGDPPWLLIVGGSGAAKTETIMPLTGAGATVVSTINGEAALLSGTSKKERADNATGGLLRQLGERGVLVIKDVTSILSMNRDTRALVLAALREIYDGQWHRNVGTDGGQTLRWSGRIVVIGAVTTAWDSAHQVISAMGDRFVLVRLNSGDHRRGAGRRAMLNVNAEIEMRAELAEVVGKVIAGADLTPVTLTEAETDVILDAADLVTRARTAVERDFQGNPEFAHALEMPTRFAKQLVQLVRGGVAAGMTREHALTIAMRAAADTMPPLRLAIACDVAANPSTVTSDVVKRLQLPRKTVDRTLIELHLLRVLHVQDLPWGDGVRWAYTLAPDISADAVQRLARNVSRGTERTAS